MRTIFILFNKSCSLLRYEVSYCLRKFSVNYFAILYKSFFVVRSTFNICSASLYSCTKIKYIGMVENCIFYGNTLCKIVKYCSGNNRKRLVFMQRNVFKFKESFTLGLSTCENANIIVAFFLTFLLGSDYIFNNLFFQ